MLIEKIKDSNYRIKKLKKRKISNIEVIMTSVVLIFFIIYKKFE